jgi:hypothetical protein
MNAVSIWESDLTSWEEYARLFVGLFAMLNVVGNMPYFLSETANFSRQDKRKCALVATLTVFLVLSRFYLDDLATINLKNTVDLEPGDEGYHAFNVDGNTPVTGVARIQLGKYISAYVCSFRLENVSGVIKTRWDRASCTGFEQPEGCPTCANSCDKSWDGYKNRWRTKFAITE